ncbi:MAG: hypothetical protein L3K25_07850 [Gammaproteobacteria bacterium]|nr:hypothetical protein [Gammaproteobacteria bacterium]
MSDNRNPFKGPFKGKGANRSALRELENELQSIHENMDSVENKYNEIFSRPRPIMLRRLRKRAYSLLWWRMVGHSGTYIRLFDSDRGREVLASLMPQSQKLLIKFDRERIRLNFRATVVGNAVQAYRMRDRDLSILKTLDLDKISAEQNVVVVDPDSVESLYD